MLSIYLEVNECTSHQIECPLYTSIVLYLLSYSKMDQSNVVLVKKEKSMVSNCYYGYLWITVNYYLPFFLTISDSSTNTIDQQTP